MRTQSTLVRVHACLTLACGRCAPLSSRVVRGCLRFHRPEEPALHSPPLRKGEENTVSRAARVDEVFVRFSSLIESRSGLCPMRTPSTFWFHCVRDLVVPLGGRQAKLGLRCCRRPAGRGVEEARAGLTQVYSRGLTTDRGSSSGLGWAIMTRIPSGSHPVTKTTPPLVCVSVRTPRSASA
jgi:hypothetical protein